MAGDILRRTSSNLLAMLTAGMLLGGPASAADEDSAARVGHIATQSGLSFYGGRAPTVSERNVDGLFVAGGSVTLDGASGNDVFAVGGEISTNSLQSGDLYLAGGRVEILGSIEDDVVATGGSLVVRRGTMIGGDGVFAGGQIRLQPTVKGDLIAVGGRVELGGSIDGNVTIASPSITLNPGTRIGGNLVYRSENELKIPEGVAIAGQVIRRDRPVDDASRGAGILAAIVGALGVAAAVFLFAAAVVAALPTLARRAAAEIDIQPLRTLGLGFAILVGVPAASILLFITLVGIPLALFVLALYAILFGLGLVSAWYWIGNRLYKFVKHTQPIGTAGQRLMWTGIGLILFLIVGFIPFLGTVMQIFVLLAGLGGFTLAAWDRRSAAS